MLTPKNAPVTGHRLVLVNAANPAERHPGIYWGFLKDEDKALINVRGRIHKVNRRVDGIELADAQDDLKGKRFVTEPPLAA